MIKGVHTVAAFVCVQRCRVRQVDWRDPLVSGQPLGPRDEVRNAPPTEENVLVGDIPVRVDKHLVRHRELPEDGISNRGRAIWRIQREREAINLGLFDRGSGSAD